MLNLNEKILSILQPFLKLECILITVLSIMVFQTVAKEDGKNVMFYCMCFCSTHGLSSVCANHQYTMMPFYNNINYNFTFPNLMQFTNSLKQFIRNSFDLLIKYCQFSYHVFIKVPCCTLSVIQFVQIYCEKMWERENYKGVDKNFK